MHHAPAGPSLAGRMAAFLRRTRLLPMTAAGLVIVGIALAGPPSAGQGQAGTAALTTPSEGGRELVPATGDGWTQDGRPPARVQPAPGSADDAPVLDLPSSAPVATPPGTSSAPAASSARTATPAATSAAPGTSGTATRPPSSAPSSSPAPAPAPAPVAPVAVPGAAQQALATVDAARSAAGCAPLTPDAVLTGAAGEHSTAMRDAGALLLPAGSGLVAGPLTDPAAVAAAWLADPALSLTDCALGAAGVAVVDGWWTLLTP